MLNGQHDMIDHEFNLVEDVIKKLYYLVDGIYPSLSEFLGPETNPATKIDCTFKTEQEGNQKMLNKAMVFSR
jgi:hypothetical protein